MWLGKIEKDEEKKKGEKLAPSTLSSKCSLLLRYLKLRKNVVLSQARITTYLKNKNARYHPQKADPVTVENVVSYVRSLENVDALSKKTLYSHKIILCWSCI